MQSNISKNSSITYQQVNSQKTLIYDLRSQLSNLKSQFSKLISKPAQIATKPKLQYKHITKSRYSCTSSETDSQSHNSSTSQISSLSKTSECFPRTSFNRSESNYQNRNIPVQQKLSNNNKRYESLDLSGQSIKNISSEQSKIQGQQQKVNDCMNGASVKKPYEFATFYKKIHSSAHDPEERFIANSRLVGKNGQVTNAVDQRSKKLEQDNKQNLLKIKQLNDRVIELQQNVNQQKNQNSNNKSQILKKNERIQKLQQSVREVTQKLIRSNDQSLQIGRQKLKQTQIMKQGHLQQLKNQQKDFEKRIQAEKQNADLKIENSIQAIKCDMENKIKYLTIQKQNFQKELACIVQKYDNQKKKQLLVEQNKKVLQNQVKQKNYEILKLNQCLVVLQNRQKQYEKQLIQLKKRPQLKQIAIQANIKQQTPKIQNDKKPVEQIKIIQTSNVVCVQPQSQDGQQIKSLQQKLTIYLNNIDKQSQKIKQQKTQLDKSIKNNEDLNKVIEEKWSVIKNLMRDCKIMQKDLNQTRRIKKQLQVLLEDSTFVLIKTNLQNLNARYKNYQI